MKLNMGMADRVARALIGLLLIAAVLKGVIGWWGWLGVVLVGTAAVSFCPLYALLGISSRPRSGAAGEQPGR